MKKLVLALLAFFCLTGEVIISSPSTSSSGAQLWNDGGSGNISPNPAAGLIVGGPVSGYTYVPGGGANTQGIVINGVDTWGSGVTQSNIIMSGVQPDVAWIKNPYPDGGCQGGIDLSFNDQGQLEFNGINCDGSNPQTLCQFNPASGMGCNTLAATLFVTSPQINANAPQFSHPSLELTVANQSITSINANAMQVDNNDNSPGLVINPDTAGSIRLGVLPGVDLWGALTNNVHFDASGNIVHDNSANAGWVMKSDARTLFPYWEWWYEPAGAGPLALNALVRIDGPNGTLSALAGTVTGAYGITPGQTLKTCTTSTTDSTHVPEGTQVTKPSDGSTVNTKTCICVRTSTNVNKWVSRDEANGTYTSTGNSTTCN